MSERRENTTSRFDGRKVGIAAAIVLAVGVIGIFALLALRAQTPAGGQQRAQPADIELPKEALANANEAPSVMDSPVESLRGSDEGRIELFDQTTGALKQTLAYSRFEPLESGRYSVTDPQARIILDDGRSIEITSRTARFVRRGSSNEPQSGEFRGDVKIRLLEPTGVDEVGLTIATDSLRFDSTLGELRTTDPVVATSAETEFKGEGLTAVYSEADRKLLYLRIEKGESLSWTPADPSAAPGQAQTSRPGSSTTRAAQTDHYRTVFTGPITIESGSRTVEAERLEVWSTLLDGGFSSEAISRIRVATGDAARPGDAPPTEAIVSANADEPVVMRWSGPLEIQPLAQKPDELANDELFVRLASPTQGLVRVRDTEAGVEASGVAFEYGLTSGAFTIAGVGQRGVTITATDRGEALGGRFEANLLEGVGAFPGPGTLRLTGAAADDSPLDQYGQPLPRDVSWQGRADFTMAKSTDGSILGALTRAVFTDGVLARDQGQEAEGMVVRLDFLERAGQSVLSRVALIDQASLLAADGGRISAKRIDLSFDDRASDPESILIQTASAEGDVRAAQGDDSIRAELVEVGFRQGDDGKAEVETFRAELGVEIALGAGEERITAVADSVRANPLDDTAELIGEPAVLRRGSATLRGRALRLDGERGAIDAFGPGEAEYLLAGASEGALPYEMIRATWNSAMSFDDSTGHAEFAGDATLQGDQGTLLRDTARAERITARFERVEDGQAVVDENAAIPGGDRRLVRAEFFSARYEGTSQTDVEIESRRYETNTDGKDALAQLLFLSGERVIVDGPSQGVTVPTPGRLVIEDRRSDGKPDAQRNGSALGGASSRGTTMFEWQGSLAASRVTGDATISNAVLVRHLPLDATQTVELEAERVSAIAPPNNGEVLVDRVEASGAVYVRSGRRQMSADRLIFSPPQSTIEAFPALGNVVTLFDPQVGSPLIARNPVYWNIATDTLRASGLEPISSPR